ncbi:EAL domain-containing protein [Zoogloea sp.]|jgi:diguanylate cyclase (GGDEF)-like protein/PAS domain S-box-containing protein|uniref:putative bifunctional diguanylate cyclase/phosphodiesterase n=1 Tax=Zoogloea sp. TaxID=49181 RepID=UPI002C25258B|nr:EAL domain-containing protein [Zoogloea sp.]HPI59020.1 EAL domain-containing protein [Zoogloea sp.]
MPPRPTPHPVVDLFRRFGLAVSVFVFVAALTLGNYHSTVEEQRTATRTRFQLTAQQQVAHLQDRITQILGHGDALQRQIALQSGEDTSTFAHLATPLLQLHPEAQRVGVVRTSNGTMSLLTNSGRGADEGASHLFGARHAPDAASQALIERSIAEAALKGHPSCTPPFSLSDGKTQAVLLLIPVQRPGQPSGAQRQVIFIEISVESLIDRALQPTASQDASMHFEIELLDATDEPRRLFASPDFAIGEMSYADVINVTDRRWLMIAAPASLSYSLKPGQDAGGRLFAGLAVGALAAFVLYVLQTRADAIRYQVREKTLALADANEALGQYVQALAETNRLLETEVDKHAKAEVLLRETTSLQRAILDCAEYAIVYTDSAGVIRVLNPAAERLFGHSAGDLIGNETPLVFHTAEDIARWTLAHRANGFAALAEEAGSSYLEPREITLRRRDGSTFPANIAISVVRDSQRQIRGYLGIIADITQRQAAERRIRHLAHYDNLTSLPNRTLLNQHLVEAINIARERHRGVAVLFTDLDRFKYVNDTLGHQAGDQLLLSVAQRLRACVRDGDMVARTGGDEFVVVLDDLQEGSMPEDVAERILASLARPFDLCSQQVTVTPSIGIALYPTDGNDGEALIKNADAAMYLAKERGRNNFQFFDHGLSARYSERLELENRLRHALDEQQLELFYQPQVDTLSGELIGMEALIRWRQPDGSMIPPDKFIPIAEECGLIVPIGAWVLQEACRQVQAWLREGICRVPVGVNLSARQFDDAGLLDTIKSALADASLAPAYLDLELTESLVMRNPEHTRSVLAECKKIGLQLSVDDFGTGYSSLANLKRFPIDRLKIDRSFIKDIVTEPDDAAIAQTIVAMAHTLRLEVIAEGVETEAQLALLRRWRCDAYQGYLCSRPISAKDMTALLRGLRASRMVSLAPM